MVMARTFVFVMPCVSAAWNVIVEVPAEDGVPEIAPVVVFNSKPAGSVPVGIDHV